MTYINEILKGIPSDEAGQVKFLSQKVLTGHYSSSTTEEHPLKYLNLSADSISSIFILNARIQKCLSVLNSRNDHQNHESAMALLNHELVFATSFSQMFRKPETTAGKEEFHRLAENLMNSASFFPEESIAALSQLCIHLTLSKQTHSLTPLQPILLSSCLNYGFYHYSLPLLENPITEIDPTNGCTIKDFLLYHYYGGMVLLALKRTVDAHVYFNLALYAPGNVASAIQVEAFKKVILTTLLLKGKCVNPLPSQMLAAVQKNLENYATSYLNFADAFDSNNFSKIRATLTSRGEEFEIDGNLGLVKQCMDSYVTQKILLLTKTYSTVPLEKIRNLIGNDPLHYLSTSSLEVKICQMIETGLLRASLSYEEGVTIVSFHEQAPEKFDTVETSKLLSSKVYDLIQTNEGLVHLRSQILKHT